jgi:hypothetical protein
VLPMHVRKTAAGRHSVDQWVEKLKELVMKSSIVP